MTIVLYRFILYHRAPSPIMPLCKVTAYFVAVLARSASASRRLNFASAMTPATSSALSVLSVSSSRLVESASLSLYTIEKAKPK